MPCNSGWDPATELTHANKRVERLTRMLCALCKRIEKIENDAAPLAEDRANLIEADERLVEWWKKHKAEDEARRQRKREERERKRQQKELKIAALQKLTIEELEALGLPIPKRRIRV